MTARQRAACYTCRKPLARVASDYKIVSSSDSTPHPSQRVPVAREETGHRLGSLTAKDALCVPLAESLFVTANEVMRGGSISIVL